MERKQKFYSYIFGKLEFVHCTKIYSGLYIRVSFEQNLNNATLWFEAITNF